MPSYFGGFRGTGELRNEGLVLGWRTVSRRSERHGKLSYLYGNWVRVPNVDLTTASLTLPPESSSHEQFIKIIKRR